jgi:hypothetical protein
VELDIQHQLLKTLSNMRYNTLPKTHTRRPKNKEELLAGASYTSCLVKAFHDEDSSGDEDAPVPAARDP